MHYRQSEKIVKKQYLHHMSIQYGELRPTSGWYRLVIFGHPSKFQRVSRLGFVTAATSLTGGQPNFARCLAVSWAATLYNTFSGALAPWRNFATCKINYVQVLRSPILAALLHGTPAAGVSQTMRRATTYKEWNYRTFAEGRAPPIFGWGPSRWASAHILVGCISLKLAEFPVMSN